MSTELSKRSGDVGSYHGRLGKVGMYDAFVATPRSSLYLLASQTMLLTRLCY